MQREMLISTYEDGVDFCNYNGFTFLDIEFINGNLILFYDDGRMERNEKEEAYYLKQYLKEQKKEQEAKQHWVIYSDDEYGVLSRLYKGKGRGASGYTFYITEAQKFPKAEAQRRAIMMTRNSKTGRKWFALQV